MARRKSETPAAYNKRMATRRKETAGKSVGQQLKDTGAALKKSITGVKNKVKDATGMARTKVKTAGGDYKVYGKGTKKAASFRSAYASSTGSKTFTWNGKKYASKGADKPTAKVTPKVKPKVKPGLKSNNQITSADIKKNPTLKPKPKPKPNFLKTATPKIKTSDGKGVSKEDLAAIRNTKKTVGPKMNEGQRRLAASDKAAGIRRRRK